MHKLIHVKRGLIHSICPSLHNLKKFWVLLETKFTLAVQKDFIKKILPV